MERLTDSNAPLLEVLEDAVCSGRISDSSFRVSFSDGRREVFFDGKPLASLGTSHLQSLLRRYGLR